MASSKDDADLTLCLEAAYSRTMAGAGIDNDEWSLSSKPCSIRRFDSDEAVIDGARQAAPVHNELTIEFHDMRSGLSSMFLIALAALLHHIEEKQPTLRGIEQV